MSFLVYDLIFLSFFVLFLFVFLYKKRKKLDREGLLVLYRTSWGIKLINKLGKKHKGFWNFLSYVSIFCGYVLMISVIYLIYNIVKIYVLNPILVRTIKVPPILPLVPYLPQVFKLEFLPPFYFTYWIVIIAIIAIFHELAHGIFAAHNKVKIKTTGFGFFPFFLPIFLAAFVELDEKKMAKKRKFSQLAILSSGTFANVITAILFFVIFVVFFIFAFKPAGIIFDSYATSQVHIATINSVNNITLNEKSYSELLNLMNSSEFNEIKSGNRVFLATKQMIENQKNNDILVLYNSAPAIKNNLSRIIIDINGEKVTSINDLSFKISKYKPGDKISLGILTDGGYKSQEIILEENPEKPGSAWLGIGFYERKSNGILRGIIQKISSFKDPNTYYETKIGELGIFIYNLIWWIILISLSVALINMLPVGIFDGGRFFYLSVLALTKNEKIARKAFIFSTQFFLFLVFVLMFFWIISFFR
ncbi:MAG: metalloprotease [Candidatus Pacearchaeota archaeon]|nr:MAG: metalloprotease [Candidatus Pacearchaeota archaeon]